MSINFQKRLSKMIVNILCTYTKLELLKWLKDIKLSLHSKDIFKDHQLMEHINNNKNENRNKRIEIQKVY